jgi:hypothetical protein
LQNKCGYWQKKGRVLHKGVESGLKRGDGKRIIGERAVGSRGGEEQLLIFDWSTYLHILLG